MIDFKIAFREGLNEAGKAIKARNEIRKVFEELNRQIQEITDNKVHIELQTFKEEVNVIDLFKFGFPNVPKYTAIAAFNPMAKDSPVKKLARWQQESKGYPCKISWDGNTKYCEDKKALETALTELLKDPMVGEDLDSLMKIEVSANIIAQEKS